MARACWLDKAPDVAAVVAHLDAAAAAAKAPLAFSPVAVPPGTDLAVLHQAALLRARNQLALSHAELDRVLANEVRAIDDLVRSANLMVERLREWYGLHAPEAARLVPDAEDLASLVAEHGERGALLASIGHAQEAATTLGSDLAEPDMAVLQGFAAALQGVQASWRALEARVSQLMEEVAPNVASVTGPVIGARLIAISGGLARLATWPSGTVQLLGAETALFRHLKEGTRPPKHGILFQHPLVHQAAPWSRGAVARALALAAATAAKADAFTKNDLRAHLKAQVDADLARIALRKRPDKPRPYAPVRKPYGRPMQAGVPASPGRRDGPPPAAPRPRDERWAPRPAGRFPPSGGPPRAPPPQGGRGYPPRGPGPGPSGPSAPGRGAPGRGTPGGKPWKRKPQGAFRSDNKPARPPGAGDRKGGAR